MELEIVRLKTKDLKPYEKNAKAHPEYQIEQIKESIKRFGMNDPIGIWGPDNLIVEGHGRWQALREMGVAEVDCVRLDHLTEEERKEYTLIHNQTTMNTGFQMDLLNEELKDIQLDDPDIDMTDFGFDMNFLSDNKEAVDDDYDQDADIPEVPYTVKGDIYILGNHRLMCGDSTNADDVATLMDGELADMVVTDPPYNVAYEGENGMTIQNDNMDDEAFRGFLNLAFFNLKANLKSGGAFYIWYASRETYNFYGALRDVELEQRQQLIWRKNSLVLGRQDYQWIHEPCIYGWKEGTHVWYNDRSQVTVMDFDKPKHNDIHPTMKPVELFAYQIKCSSKPGERVLDLFGGSGTTLVASQQLDRKGYAMEFDEKYADAIVKRMLRQLKTTDGCYLIRNGEQIPLSEIPELNQVLSEE